MTIRIFVGTPANNEDLECQAVLDHSLKKHATEELDITWMMLSRDLDSPWYSGDPHTRSGWNQKTWATPFSALRWGIPAACNYEGLAIYMDCDQIAMADIAELHRQSIPDGKAFLAKESGGDVVSCVLLMDCARMRYVLPPIETLKNVAGAYRQARHSIFGAMALYQGDWNCRDGEGCADIHEPHVKVVHYTNIPTQPNHRLARARLAREGRLHWFNGGDRDHPRQDIQKLFDDTYAEACAAGRGPEVFRVKPEFGPYGIR